MNLFNSDTNVTYVTCAAVCHGRGDKLLTPLMGWTYCLGRCNASGTARGGSPAAGQELTQSQTSIGRCTCRNPPLLHPRLSSRSPRCPSPDLSLDDLDDAELLALARRDHDEAYAALFRRHSYAAHRLARHLGHREESEDIVAESFAQVLDLFRRGKGPERAFRAYLFTTVRHEAGRRAKARQRVMPTDDERQIDSVVPFGNGRLEGFEQAAVRGAYESLPERWRAVLWHLDVEGRKPQEIGPILKLVTQQRLRVGLPSSLGTARGLSAPARQSRWARCQPRVP